MVKTKPGWDIYEEPWNQVPTKSFKSQEILEDCSETPLFGCYHWLFWAKFEKCLAGSHKVDMS